MKLLERYRNALVLRHRSTSTIEAYSSWVRRYIRFHQLRHPADLGGPDVVAFLEHLARDEHVAESTQTQALCALAFLYRHVLDKPLGELGSYAAARAQKRLPTVLTEAEVRSVLACVATEQLLAAQLLYGAGLRVGEAVTLRVKDVDFERGEVTLRDTKGRSDRVGVLPASIVPALKALLGHKSISTTQVYLHVLGLGAHGIRSPLDR